MLLPRGGKGEDGGFSPPPSSILPPDPLFALYAPPWKSDTRSPPGTDKRAGFQPNFAGVWDRFAVSPACAVVLRLREGCHLPLPSPPNTELVFGIGKFPLIRRLVLHDQRSLWGILNGELKAFIKVSLLSRFSKYLKKRNLRSKALFYVLVKAAWRVHS